MAGDPRHPVDPEPHQPTEAERQRILSILEGHRERAAYEKHQAATVHNAFAECRKGGAVAALTEAIDRVRSEDSRGR